MAGTKRTKLQKMVVRQTSPEPDATAAPDAVVPDPQPVMSTMPISTEEPAAVDNGKGSATVLIMDEAGIRLGKHKPVGTVWRFRGENVYVARIDGDQLVEFNPLAHTTNGNRPKYTPEDLFDAIHWHEVKVIYHIAPSVLNKLNTGLIIALVGILLFFIFLLFSSITGG